LREVAMSKEIWVVAEMRDDEPTRTTAQVLGAAAKLSAEKGIEV